MPYSLLMVKWRKVREKDIVNEPLHRWLTWFDPGSDPELVAEVVGMDRGIQKAQERQEYVLSDREVMRIHEAREMAELDRLSRENRARRKGRAEGHAEGRAEGREEANLEIARKMKNAGKPFSEISEFTGISLEQIEGI